LIKVRHRLPQLDGEQGLDAGVQVEGFTGPTGSDGLGVGMLEAVPCGELIMLCLLSLPAQREIKMPRQVLVINPRLAGLPVGSGEQPTITITADGDAALVDGGVMPLSEFVEPGFRPP